MSERTYTEAEVRAAMTRVVKGTYVEAAQEEYTKRDVDAVIAELTKPAIHGDVPVMFRDTSGINVSTARFTGEGYPERANIRALVPIDAAVDKAYKIASFYVNPIASDPIRDDLKEWRDHYLETGETE